MSDMHEVKRLIEEQGRDWQEAKTATDMRFKDIEEHILSKNRPFVGGTTPAKVAHELWHDVKTKKSIPVLSHSQSLAALESRTDTPSIGRLLRGIVLGGRADDANELADERKSLGINSDPSGGYSIAGALSSEWIDSLRAQMVLSRAGCRTIPMDTASLSLARVIADPIISWHAENAALGTCNDTHYFRESIPISGSEFVSHSFYLFGL